jgi:ERCC4-type nuclease
MKILIKVDNREHDLIQSCKYFLNNNSTYQNIVFEVQNLPIGDAILCDESGNEKVIIERKSIADLASSIKDGRYEEQSFRLQGNPLPNHNIIYVIEGDLNKINAFKGRIDRSTMYSAMFSLNYYKGFSVLRSNSLDETAYMICHMANKLGKGIAENRQPYYTSATLKNVNTDATTDTNTTAVNEENKEYCSVVKKVKKENVTVNNIGEIMLCQIPGISSTTAIVIMAQFKNLPNLVLELKTNPDCLQGLSYSTEKGQTRKISKTVIENITNYLRTSE